MAKNKDDKKNVSSDRLPPDVAKTEARHTKNLRASARGSVDGGSDPDYGRINTSHRKDK